LTIHDTAEEILISKAMGHEIFAENLGMHHVAGKFVPHLLSEDQKKNHVDVSKEPVYHANCDENFVKNIVTRDETWV
jgi:hypothetical protein